MRCAGTREQFSAFSSYLTSSFGVSTSGCTAYVVCTNLHCLHLDEKGTQSSGAVPFTTMFALLVLWPLGKKCCTPSHLCKIVMTWRFGISVPLVFLGAFFGYKKVPVVTLVFLERCAYARPQFHCQSAPTRFLGKSQPSLGTSLGCASQSSLSHVSCHKFWAETFSCLVGGVLPFAGALRKQVSFIKPISSPVHFALRYLLSCSSSCPPFGNTSSELGSRSIDFSVGNLASVQVACFGGSTTSSDFSCLFFLSWW